MNKEGKIRVVIFYSVMAHYVTGVLEALKKCGKGLDIDVVFWDKRSPNSNLYKVEELESVRCHARSLLDNKALLDLLHTRNPHITYISGWMDKGYLQAIKRYRSEGGRTQVVCGIDDQWKGTLRQRLGQIYFRFFYRKIFDFMWVSGKPQYHYAQRFGYDHERIISNMLSADTSVFDQKHFFSRRFIFVGRFVPVKGLDLLLDAYLSLPAETRSEWPLILIGDGGIKHDIEKRASERITVKPFMQPDALREELMHGGVACIPSHEEQWGVAIHEMALLGYPLIISSACGAATEFLITGYNGFLFRKGDAGSLRDAMMRIASLSMEELETFTLRSHMLGQRITSEHTAYSLLSVLDLARI